MPTQKQSLQSYVEKPLKQAVVNSAKRNNRTQSQEVEHVLTAHYGRKK
jgi:hypothetical protein